MKTIRISKEKRDKNGNRNVKNTLRNNSSHIKRLKSKFGYFCLFKKEKKY